ncbi:hypothetical protein F4825DRAFT_467620 [Nemania diffusa]|nr:hypothetical protein F4825DRAFT_467620 [Nemania diffusa]
MSSPRKKPFDLIRRGEKKPTLSGTLTFIGLRLADLPLQHALLSPTTGLGVHLLSSLGLRTIYTSPPPTIPPSLLLPVSHLLASSSYQPSRSLGWIGPLASLPPTPLLLFLMSVGSAAKQIYWHLALSQDSFPASAAVAVSAYNTLVNAGNALLFLALGTTSLLSPPRITLPSFLSPFFSSAPVESSSRGSAAAAATALPLSTLVGAALYVAGMAVETLSERQRADFKSRAENKGRVCMQGLWRWARHVNYLGYALWRGGYCMVGAGWVGGALMALWQGWDLSSRAVAVQDEYCARRYGEQWVRFKREVPYRIVPGVY